MNKKLLMIGGIVNALFTVFHLFLGVELFNLTGIPEEVHALLAMLNVGGSLFILFFTLAFLVYPETVLGTGLGRLTLLFCALLYGTRALEEIVWAPAFMPLIFVVCLVTTGLFGLIWWQSRPSGC